MNSLTTTLEVRQGDADFSFEGSRVALFFSLFRARLGMLLKLNLMIALFAVPSFLALYYYSIQSAYIGAIMPYSSHYGASYPVIMNPAEIASQLIFDNRIFLHLILTGGIALLCAALSGAFFVMRQLARGEIVPVFKNYFIGVKRHVVPFLCAAPILAGMYFLAAYGFSSLSMPGMALGLKIFLIVVILLVLFILITAAIFFFTQTVTFKIKTGALLKNSFVFAFKLLWRSTVVLIFCAVPFGLMYLMLASANQILLIVGLMLALAFLFSYVVLMWTVYAQWAFDKYLAAYDNEPADPADAKKRKVVVIQPSELEAVTDSAQADPTEEPSPAEAAESTETAENAAETGARASKEAPAQKPNNASAQKPSSAFKFKKKK